MFRTLLFLFPIMLSFYGGWLMFSSYPLLLIPVIWNLVLYIYDGDKYRWIPRFGLGVDQLFNVVFYQYLNLILDPKTHLFGHPDETVSSVIGKNLLHDDRKHWHYIEKLLVLVLEGGKRDHSIPSIEKDEGYRK